MPKSMVKLIATKAYSYATRRLKAEDEFEARPMDANLLVRAKKARYSDSRETGKLAAPPAKLKRKAAKTAKKPARTAKVEPAEPEGVSAMTAAVVNPASEPAALASAPTDELTALRQQYKDKFGKSPFMGWSAATLQDKLAEK